MYSGVCDLSVMSTRVVWHAAPGYMYDNPATVEKDRTLNKVSLVSWKCRRNASRWNGTENVPVVTEIPPRFIGTILSYSVTVWKSFSLCMQRLIRHCFGVCWSCCRADLA